MLAGTYVASVDNIRKRLVHIHARERVHDASRGLSDRGAYRILGPCLASIQAARSRHALRLARHLVPAPWTLSKYVLIEISFTWLLICRGSFFISLVWPCQACFHLIEKARQLLSFVLVVLEKHSTAVLASRDLLLELDLLLIDLVLALVLVEIGIATFCERLRGRHLLLLGKLLARSSRPRESRWP